MSKTSCRILLYARETQGARRGKPERTEVREDLSTTATPQVAAESRLCGGRFNKVLTQKEHAQLHELERALHPDRMREQPSKWRRD